MRRSESQSLYSALPGACISYTSSSKDDMRKKYANKKSIKIEYWNSRKIEKNDIYYPKIIDQIEPDLCDFKSDTNDKVKKNEVFNIGTSMFLELQNIQQTSSNWMVLWHRRYHLALPPPKR